MIRTVPITAVQAAVYKTLNKCLEDYPILDDSTPFEDGKAPAPAYCIIGPISAVPDGSKSDAALWNCTVTIDVYSDYCGKKIINQMLDEIVTVLTMTAESNTLEIDKYNLICLNIELVEVHAEEWNDGRIWQHGTIRAALKIDQKNI